MHAITQFWLDFKGPGPPGGFKKQKKQLTKSHRFLDEKKRPKLFWVILGSLLVDFRLSLGALSLEGLGDRSGIVFGSIFEPSWLIFGNILKSLLKRL